MVLADVLFRSVRSSPQLAWWLSSHIFFSINQFVLHLTQGLYCWLFCLFLMRLLYNATNSSQWPLHLCTNFYNLFFCDLWVFNYKRWGLTKVPDWSVSITFFCDEKVNGSKLITPIIKNSELPTVLACM